MTAARPRQLLFDLEPTIAMRRGASVVDQCAECGALVAHERKDKLGSCPACGDPRRKWWRQTLPVGPFKRRRVRP